KTIEEALARVIGDQQLADALLRAVGGQRRGKKLIVNGLRKWRPEYGNGAREDQARLMAGGPNGLEQQPRAIEIDAVAFGEIELPLAREEGGQMKDDVGPVGEELVGLACSRQVAAVDPHRHFRGRRCRRRGNVIKIKLCNRLAVEAARLRQPFGQLAA